MSHTRANHDRGSEDRLKAAFFLNLRFTIIEIVGGLWTNCIAIPTDALRDAGDTVSLGLAWYFKGLSERGLEPQHTFGYKRFRLLGGLITAGADRGTGIRSVEGCRPLDGPRVGERAGDDGAGRGGDGGELLRRAADPSRDPG